jgi:hypothetical protein
MFPTEKIQTKFIYELIILLIVHTEGIAKSLLRAH